MKFSQKLLLKGTMSKNISNVRISSFCTLAGVVAVFLCLITMAIISLGDKWYFNKCHIIPRQDGILLVKPLGATLEDNVWQELQRPTGLNVSTNSTLNCWTKDRGSGHPDEISLTEKYNYDHMTGLSIGALVCVGWVLFCGGIEACIHFKPYKRCQKNQEIKSSSSNSDLELGE
jgi:hypothetical protein